MAATGLCFTRYCTQVKPFNVMLASGNFFMATIAMYQLTRKAYASINLLGTLDS